MGTEIAGVEGWVQVQEQEGTDALSLSAGAGVTGLVPGEGERKARLPAAAGQLTLSPELVVAGPLCSGLCSAG